MKGSICLYERKEGQKARREGGGDYPCELPITDTDFCVYISTDLLIHPWTFRFEDFLGILCV